MNKTTNFVGKSLYALVFLVIIPIGLWIWAKYTEHLIKHPVIDSSLTGWILTISGVLLIISAMFSLMKYGKGLPMNAYPPSILVKGGAYQFLRHPIYWGFGLFITGFFILSKSASGLWLVTPVTILGMIALVLGYEAIDLKKRFPSNSFNTRLDLPKNNPEPTSPRDHFASLFWVMALLLLGNYTTSIMSVDSTPLFGKSLELELGFKNHYLSYLSVVLIIIIPFIIKRNDILREWVITSILALSASLFIALLFPALNTSYLFTEDKNIITAPSYLILISLWSVFLQSRRSVLFLSLVAAPLIIIQLTQSNATFLHLIYSIFITIVSINYFRIWTSLKSSSEKIANSWKEWRFGKIRVINHGFYAGFAAFFGILIAGVLTGKEYAWAILVFAVTVIVFSAFWAQIIEGSEKLKRPFGYYGALVGIIFANLVVWTMGYNGWIIIGVISVAMPWVQAIGRLRCLVNGCCHGSKVDNPIIGIRYFHHRSRVCGISGLKGALLHPTPLYSIIWLFLVGFILFSLWYRYFSSTFIFGIYLILTGIGRFVEEAYRGEVQTPIIKKLRLYQWTAILSVFTGIIITLIHVAPVPHAPSFSWNTVLAAFIGGIFTTFAMGIDFPYSNARFSRLV